MQRSAWPHKAEPYFRGITLHWQSITQTEHPTMANTYMDKHLHGVNKHLHGVDKHLHGVDKHLHGVDKHLHGDQDGAGC